MTTEITTDTNSIDAQSSPAERNTFRFRNVLVLGVLLLPLVALWGFGGDDSPETSANAQSLESVSLDDSDSGNSGSQPESAAKPVPISDETYRKLIVGNWETDRDGRRFLQVFENGTAVMDVTIPSGWSLLFGEKMKFDIVWSIEDGVLTFETTGGEPKAKVDLITGMYGKQRVQKIKILDETTLRLPDDEPDGEDHVWTRVGPADAQQL